MKRFFKALGRKLLSFLRGIFPVRGDPKREWIRKLAFLSALIVFIGAAGYLIDDLWIQPEQARQVLTTVRRLYHEDTPEEKKEEAVDTTVYPDGMNESFRSLYRHNNDVRGWLTFTTSGGDLFEGAVDNPVVQASDNDYYLNRDFLGNKNKAGTLYFDSRNDLSAAGENRNLIIYGHNLKSGLMFSHFNRLITVDNSRAQRLSTLTLDTLYEQRTYKILAVMVIDADADAASAFNYLRTEFTDDAQFLQFVEYIRARSLYDFGDVDVAATDELLTLSTCSNKRDTNLKDGRTVIVARRVRDGESTAVDTSKTVVNTDVLMPKAWYEAAGAELPQAYQ